jgi:uncharacterized protein (DUF1501 family)
MLDTDISTADALRHLSQFERDAHHLDRRRFLQLVGMGAGAGVAMGSGGSLLDGLFLPGSDPSAWAAGPVGPTDGIIVVIGMYGGNDGLNTVVPHGDGAYYTMHGALAIPAGQTLPLASGVGLNPRLTEFKKFWDAGQLAIVEGIGYANPDLSHFNSMAYWMAGRPNALPSSGWIGRWLDGYLGATRDLYAAAEIGYSVPLHLIGQQQRATVVPATRPGYGSDTSPRYQAQYNVLRALNNSADPGWEAAVTQAFVDQIDLAQQLAPVIPDESLLPDTQIAAQLEIAARLINANLGFRVVSAGFGDFDSHAGQPAQHNDRMTELNAAVKRFFDTLEPAWRSRVTVMTFSEFGRTPWDNDGAGTDHGTSAPHFVFGENVKGGFYGQRPTLSGLGRWDRMVHHVDFRSYYASIIDGWLGGGSSDILGGTFENLNLFRRGPGIAPGGGIAPGPAVVTAPSRFVPLTPARIADTRSGLGGVPARPLNAGETCRIKVAGVGDVPTTGATAVVANVTAVGPTQNMFFTVYPGSTAQPGTASLNGMPGRPIPNLVVMAVGADGYIDVFNSHGLTHCVVDVFGYFSTTSGDRFTPLPPQRLFDSRTGVGVPTGKLREGAPLAVQVSGRAGVPPSGATAVVLNLAVAQTESAGHVSVAPAGSKSAVSNINYAAGDIVPNLVICKLGTGGKIELTGVGAGTHVVGDVFGYFGASGHQLRATPPQRAMDTRKGIGAAQQLVGPGHDVRLDIAGRNGVPMNATAVVLNVAATNVSAKSYLSIWPSGTTNPGTANLNIAPGRVIANLVICRLGTDGAVSISNPIGGCHVVADVFGYFVE